MKFDSKNTKRSPIKMITEIENSITIIYYDNDSYLHHLYIGYAIATLKDCLLSIAV